MFDRDTIDDLRLKYHLGMPLIYETVTSLRILKIDHKGFLYSTYYDQTIFVTWEEYDVYKQGS